MIHPINPAISGISPETDEWVSKIEPDSPAERFITFANNHRCEQVDTIRQLRVMLD